jgi:hypothetical protein
MPRLVTLRIKAFQPIHLVLRRTVWLPAAVDIITSPTDIAVVWCDKWRVGA